MRALYLLLPILCILAIAYRYYSAFIAARIMALDDTRRTPAHLRRDGHNYHPTHRLVLFGHHFAAIAGAGPLIGPVLAAQFGYAPGLIWLVCGVCLAGAVHDFIILWASVRRGGRSLAEMTRMEIGPVAGTTAAIAILFIIVIALSGLTSSFAMSLGLGAAYVFGMVAPLFVISLLWERFDWRSSRLFRPRTVTWRLGPVRRTITGSAETYLVRIKTLAKEHRARCGGGAASLTASARQVFQAVTESLDEPMKGLISSIHAFSVWFSQ